MTPLFDTASLIHFLPELVLSATAMGLVLVAALSSRTGEAGGGAVVLRTLDVASWMGIGGMGLAFWFLMRQGGGAAPFGGLLASDGPAWFVRALVVVAGVLAAVFSQRSAELGSFPAGRKGQDSAEFTALLLGVVVGAMLLAQAANLLVLYLALEFAGLLSALLVGFSPRSARSAEAALKYVLYGAVASGVFLFGASIFFGLTGSLDLVAGVGVAPSAALSVAGVLILAGLLFKIAAVPMQAWCPDAYEGAPTPVAAFLSVAPKAAAVVAIARILYAFGFPAGWPSILAVLSAATMTFGNLAAIPQMSVKRLLAYSSIAHAGYLLIGVACGTTRGVEAVLFYLLTYFLMNLGAFLVVQIVANRFGSEGIESWRGLGRRGPYGTAVAVGMMIFLLSLTGIPPAAGFVGKFFLFTAAIQADLLWLAVVGIANSVVSLFYYMRIAKAMFFDPPADDAPLPIEGEGLAVLLGLLALATVLLGLFWEWAGKLAAAAAM